MAFSKGDKVTWNTPQGTTEGKVVEKHVKEFSFADQTFKASKDEPYYTVESAKSGKQAAHKESALSKK
ncbi:hypervirulence associated TUDOR domain-containing protein [Arthrobacter sp. TMS2-4]